MRLEDYERDCVNVLVDGFHRICNFLNIFFTGTLILFVSLSVPLVQR